MDLAAVTKAFSALYDALGERLGDQYWYDDPRDVQTALRAVQTAVLNVIRDLTEEES